MIVQKLITKKFRKKGGNDGADGSCFVILIIIVILAAGLINFVDWARPAKPLPLLTQAEGMVQVETLEVISNYTQTSVTPPQETFGAELYVAGIYTEVNDLLPQHTVALVYTRDNWRFIEIDYKPITLEEHLSTSRGFDPTEVVLTPEVTGTLITLDHTPRCIEPVDDRFPGKCEISTQLSFELDGTTITISADGTHATEGELIEIGRSIIE